MSRPEDDDKHPDDGDGSPGEIPPARGLLLDEPESEDGHRTPTKIARCSRAWGPTTAAACRSPTASCTASSRASEGMRSASDELKGQPAKSARVFAEIEDACHLARKFRELHLPAAGINRAELFENTKARKHITAYNLRATIVTISLANGRTSDGVADRTGQKSTGQIATYKRAARMVEEVDLGPLAALDQGTPELRSAREVRGEPSGRRRQRAPRRRNRPGKASQWTGGDLNPYALRRRNLNPLRMPISPPVPGDPSAN